MKSVIVNPHAGERTMTCAYEAAARVFVGVGATPLQSSISDWRRESTLGEMSESEERIGWAWIRAMDAVSEVFDENSADMRVAATKAEVIEAMRDLGTPEEGMAEFLSQNRDPE